MASLTRTIEIDFDVHRHIEAARQGFDDPPNAVLRRLLGIDNNDTGSQESSSATPGAASTDPGVPWTRKGILLPDGTELQVRYAEVKADGRVTGGKLVLNGKEFDAPSKAVIEVVAPTPWEPREHQWLETPVRETARAQIVDVIGPSPRDPSGRVNGGDMKAWLVTWKWVGDHAAVDIPFIAILSGRLGAERVQEFIERHHNRHCRLSPRATRLCSVQQANQRTVPCEDRPTPDHMRGQSVHLRTVS